MKKYKSILTIDPKQRSGKPCIRGLRITVFDILSNLAAGLSHSQIINEYPELTEEDILACLEYAADRESQTLVG